MGRNSFVTIEEADEYLAGEAGAERWAELSDTNKEACLITAFRRVELLRLRGGPSPSWGYAQILEAFDVSNPARRATADRQARGVMSVSIGNASESYDTSFNPGSPETFGIPLFSMRAYRLLRPYMQNGAVIV